MRDAEAICYLAAGANMGGGAHGVRGPAMFQYTQKQQSGNHQSIHPHIYVLFCLHECWPTPRMIQHEATGKHLRVTESTLLDVHESMFSWTLRKHRCNQSYIVFDQVWSHFADVVPVVAQQSP